MVSLYVDFIRAFHFQMNLTTREKSKSSLPYEYAYLGGVDLLVVKVLVKQQNISILCCTGANSRLRVHAFPAIEISDRAITDYKS